MIAFFKKHFAVITAVAAFATSVASFVSDRWPLHDLKVSVVNAEFGEPEARADMLFINSGKSHETVFSAVIVLSKNLLRRDPTIFFGLSPIAPIVIKPGEAVVIGITGPAITEEFAKRGKLSVPIQVGVKFDVVDSAGEVISIMYPLSEVEVFLAGSGPGTWQLLAPNGRPLTKENNNRFLTLRASPLTDILPKSLRDLCGSACQ